MKKIAVITGASSGIGEATARELAGKGYDLWLLARRKDRLEKLKKTLLAVHPGIHVHVDAVDLQVPEQIEKLVQDRAPLVEGLTVLVNNAGLAKGIGKFQDSNWQDTEQMLLTNISGLLFLTRKLLPSLLKKKAGHIVNMGSVAGRWVYPGGAVYCATKFALRAFSDGLRQDLVGSGIRITNIEPGMVETEFSLVRFGDQGKADQVYQDMRPLTAKDIAETILWVLDRPAHVNVQELVIFPTDQAAIGLVHRGKQKED